MQTRRLPGLFLSLAHSTALAVSPGIATTKQFFFINVRAAKKQFGDLC